MNSFIIFLIILIIINIGRSVDPTTTTTTTTTTTSGDGQSPPGEQTTTTTTIPIATIPPITTNGTDPTIDNPTGKIIPPTTKPVVKTTSSKIPTTQKEITKVYPQETMVPWKEQNDDDDDTGVDLMNVVYILSGVISTVLVGYASYTLYKKGLGDESPASSRIYENSFGDDGYRNKSTISRNTLTPSLKDMSLSSNLN